MPSRIRPILQPGKIAFTEGLKPVPVRLHAFFKGMTPDMSPWATESETACQLMRNLVYSGEHLSTDYGYAQLDPARLQLGATEHATQTNTADAILYSFNRTDADTPSGGVFFHVVQPVNGLFKHVRLDATGRLGVSQMALTANTASTMGGGVIECGQMFFIDTVGTQWTGVRWFSCDGTAAPDDIAGDTPIMATNTVAWQATTYSGGLSGTSAPIAGVFAIASARSVFLCTNGFDRIMMYPVLDPATATDCYQSFLSRATQLAAVATAANTVLAGTGVVPAFTSFKAKSICPFDGRCFYLNTTEGSTVHNQRLRWSIIGEPTIVWPTFTVTHANYTANGVGSGWIDFREFAEEGQCVKPIGEDRVAVYFRDGVAFLRRTGIPTAAYARSYVSRTRGLLGPNAVCDLGGGVHFGIFNDGWHMLNSDGGWTEVGYVGQESVIESLVEGSSRKAAHKWKEWFYQDLNPAKLDLIQCVYDVYLKQVRIIWPGRASLVPDRCATYDPQNDRLTQFDYSNVGGIDQTPNCIGHTDLSISTGLSWATYGGTWEAAATRWSDHQKFALEVGWAHGTVNGFVYQHDPSIATYDSQPVTWSADSLPNAYGVPEKLHGVDRVWVEYEQVDPTGVAVTVRGWDGASNEVSNGASWDMGKGLRGDPGVDHADVRVPGHNHQLSISGAGQILIRSMTVEVVGDLGPAIREEGT